MDRKTVRQFTGTVQKPTPKGNSYEHIFYIAQYPNDWTLRRCKAHFRRQVSRKPEFSDATFKMNIEEVYA